MNTTFNKIASVLAFIIGGMAIFAGGKVLLGNDPGYYVINWLPLYNYTIGILTNFHHGHPDLDQQQACHARRRQHIQHSRPRHGHPADCLSRRRRAG